MKILIAGAGIIGLSTALKLAQAGVTIHLLDPRSPGHGASLAALGALWPGGPFLNSPLQSLHRQSLAHFHAFTQSIAEKSNLPITYQQLGRIEILNSPKSHLHAKKEAAASTSLAVLDYPAAKILNPGLAPFHDSALHCRITAQVNVHELITALTRACELANITFHQTPVTALLQNKTRITAFQTPNGPLQADIFLIAAGAWTPLLSPLLENTAPIRPVKGQGIALQMPSSPPLATIIKSGPTYLIPWQNEILVGSTTEPQANFNESPTDTAKQTLHTAATAILPELRAAKILRHWAGLRPCTPPKSHPPIMGPHPHFPNLYISAGHYKAGIGLAPLASELLSQSILNSQTPTLLTPFLPKPS